MDKVMVQVCIKCSIGFYGEDSPYKFCPFCKTKLVNKEWKNPSGETLKIKINEGVDFKVAIRNIEGCCK